LLILLLNVVLGLALNVDEVSLWDHIEELGVFPALVILFEY